MIKNKYEDLDKLIDDITNYQKKLNSDNYKSLLENIKDLTYEIIIGNYNNWDEVHTILRNLKDIVIIIVDRDTNIGDYENNQKLINDNTNDSGDTYENIISIMDTILEQTLDIEPYCDSEHIDIIEQNQEEAYKIIQDTIEYIKGSGYSDCCDDIFYRWAVIYYDKVFEIVYRDESWDEDIETVIFTNFENFQDFIRDTYHYCDNDLTPTIFNITFTSKLFENIPKLKVDLRNVEFTDLDIEDFAVTTLLTYLSENWNDMITSDDIIKSGEYDPKKALEWTENEKAIENVHLLEMMKIADDRGENDKMTLGQFRQSNSLSNI